MISVVFVAFRTSFVGCLCQQGSQAFASALRIDK